MAELDEAGAAAPTETSERSGTSDRSEATRTDPSALGTTDRTEATAGAEPDGSRRRVISISTMPDSSPLSERTAGSTRAGTAPAIADPGHERSDPHDDRRVGDPDDANENAYDDGQHVGRDRWSGDRDEHRGVTRSDTGDDTADVPAGRRPSRWDRPPPPKDWRWWVGNLGRTMIATGFLLLGFVAYQLWGTGIETARAQRALESDFQEQLAAAPAVEPPAGAGVTGAGANGESSTVGDPAGGGTATDANQDGDQGGDQPDGVSGTLTDEAATDPASVPLPVESQNIPFVENGDALARLEIPTIGVDDIVVAGVQTSDLKKGPGHFPETPLPGQLGNAAIAGHRTTYGQPFHNVDKLVPGDEMVVTTLTGRYVYVVTAQQIVSPSDYQVVTTVDPTVASLTLTSCHPKWTARERIVISGVLDPTRSGPVGEPVINYGRPIALDDETLDAVASEPTIPGENVDADPDADSDVAADAPTTGSVNESATLDELTIGVTTITSGATDASIADAFAEGWFSDPDAFWHVAFWALVLLQIWLLGYLLSRYFRRTWVGLAAGVLPFLVVLYFFYQNVNRLLPPNL